MNNPLNYLHPQSHLRMMLHSIEYAIDHPLPQERLPAERPPESPWEDVLSYSIPPILWGRSQVPVRSAIYIFTPFGLQHVKLKILAPEPPPPSKKFTLAGYGELGRFAAKAAMVIKNGSEICCFNDDTKISEMVADPSPLHDREVVDLTDDGKDLPFYTVFIPTMGEEDANVELITIQGTKRKIVAIKDIRKNDPLTIQVPPDMFMRWSLDHLYEFHDGKGTVEPFEIDPSVVYTNQLTVPADQKKRWEKVISTYRNDFPDLVCDNEPNAPATAFIIQELVLKEIARALNPQIDDQFPDYLEVQHVSDAVGYGAFATRDIEKNAYFALYSGKMTSKPLTPEDRYAFAIDHGSDHEMGSWHISSKSHGNATRFINHANSNQAECNAWVISRILGDRVYLLFQARKNIPEGTEIRYNYGAGYWNFIKEVPLVKFQENDPHKANGVKRKSSGAAIKGILKKRKEEGLPQSKKVQPEKAKANPPRVRFQA